MFLFELAMELGVRSADMAEAAPSLGLTGITPTSEVTPEQANVFRSRFAPAAPLPPGPGGPAGGSPYHPPTGPPQAPPPGWAPPPGPGGGRRMGGGQIALLVFAVLAVIGLFAFMATSGGPDKERERALARTAAERDAESKAKAKANATADPKRPSDPRFCEAGLAIYDWVTTNQARMDAANFEGTKALMVAGFGRWESNINILRVTTPAAYRSAVDVYANERRAYYQTWLNSTSIDDILRYQDSTDRAPSQAAWSTLATVIEDNCEWS